MAKSELQIDPGFLTGPIPGASLTTEPGNRPWENPPQFTTIQEVADFYAQRILDDDTQDLVVSTLDQGISVDIIVEQLTTAAVMEGYHSIDVAVLIAPIVRELIMYIGDINDIDYVVSYEDMQKAKRVPYKLAKDIATEVVQQPRRAEEDREMPKEKPASRGLMAKRSIR
jgi:hypothetical protein